MHSFGAEPYFHPKQLTGEDIELLQSVERLAIKHEFIAKALRNVVSKCEETQTVEGIGEMVAYSFNAQQFTPNYGGGGGGLPPGKYKGVIVDSTQERAKPPSTAGMLVFHLTPIEGPLAGQKHPDRLNLHHTNPVTVQIANEQLSAYCHVLGRYNFNDTAELHNIPFFFEIGWQKGQEPGTPGGGENGGYTEVKAIADINGNPPGKAGAGPAPAAQPAQPPAQPPAAQPAQPAAAGWGGAPAAQPQPQPQPAPVAAPGGGWGAPPPAAQPQPAAPAAGAPPAAWGGPPAGGAPAGWGS